MSDSKKLDEMEQRDGDSGGSPARSVPSPSDSVDTVEKEEKGKENVDPPESREKDVEEQWHSMVDVMAGSSSGSDGNRRQTRPAPVSDQIPFDSGSGVPVSPPVSTNPVVQSSNGYYTSSDREARTMQRSDRQFTLPLSRPRERGGLSTDEESLAFGHGRRRIAHEQRVPLYDVSNGRDQYSMQGQGYQFNMSGGQYVRGSAGMQRPSMDYVRGEMVSLRPGRGASNALAPGGGGRGVSVAELLDPLYAVVRCYSFTPEIRYFFHML